VAIVVSILLGVSSGAEELGERLCLLLPVMSEFGETIYPSGSKSEMRYSPKRNDAQLNKFLLAKSLAAITASHSPLGHHPSPPLESVAIREPPVSFCQRDFLLPCNRSSPLVEVGESSREGVSKEVVGSPAAVFDAALCLKLWGFPLRGP